MTLKFKFTLMKIVNYDHSETEELTLSKSFLNITE